MLNINCIDAPELTGEFIAECVVNLSTSKEARPGKPAQKREKPREFFSFFLETFTETTAPREERRAREAVAEMMSRSRDRLKACGIKETTAAPDLLQKRALQLDSIAAVCAVYQVSCVVISGKVAFDFQWGTNPAIAKMIIERRSRTLYVRSPLSYQHILENYIVVQSVGKPLMSIGKYNVAEVRKMWDLCELPKPSPRTKKDIYAAVSTYVEQQTISRN